MLISDKDAARFWSKVQRGAPDVCWPWLSITNRGGYGHFGLKRKSRTAHRISYILSKGEIPSGMVLRHTCDNPKCCNPAHLLVGTQQDNMTDMVARNRQAKGGEDLKQAKLTVDIVRAIRVTEGSYSTIAKRFGISPAQVCRIKLREQWVHVE